MSTTFAPPLALVVGESSEVLGLDEAATLTMVGAERRLQDQAAARELMAVAHWLDLHRVDRTEPLRTDAAVLVAPGGPDLLGREGVLQLAGEGTFTVEEFAVSQLATVLGLSETGARAYAGQTLELRDRLPRLWQRVMETQLPAWKARQVAAETIPLNPAATAYVDAHLAPFAAKMSLGRILRCRQAAAIRHDRELAIERARRAAESRGVWVDDDLDGTSRITAVTTTPDAAAFEAAVHTVAGDLATLGSTAPEQVRRATAVGVLADPQYALDLHTTADTAARGEVVEERAKRASRNQSPTIHLHLHLDAVNGVVSDVVPDDGTAGVVRVQGRGPRSLETVQQWLAGLAPGAVVKVTPVVDLTEHISVDAREVPDRLRSQVEHRDDSCRFPWCGRRGVFDVDHIDPYVAMDDGGPPGQTNTANSARLCRFHHRLKTHGHWRYRRDSVTSVTWTSPLGRVYTVDEHGTVARDLPGPG
jgi:hypothetical protein